MLKDWMCFTVVIDDGYYILVKMYTPISLIQV